MGALDVQILESLAQSYCVFLRWQVKTRYRLSGCPKESSFPLRFASAPPPSGSAPLEAAPQIATSWFASLTSGYECLWQAVRQGNPPLMPHWACIRKPPPHGARSLLRVESAPEIPPSAARSRASRRSSAGGSSCAGRTANDNTALADQSKKG